VTLLSAVMPGRSGDGLQLSHVAAKPGAMARQWAMNRVIGQGIRVETVAEVFRIEYEDGVSLSV